MTTSNRVETKAPASVDAEVLAAEVSRPRRRPLRREGEERGSHPELRLSATLLAVTVVGSLLAVGSVHVPVLVAVASCAFAALAITLYRAPEARLALPISLPLLTFVALVAYTLIQAAPMPIGWLRVLSPANADVWDRHLLPLGAPGPAWASLSLDPGATLVEALRWGIYAAVFATAAMIASKRGVGWGVAIVFGSAVLAALTTLGHGLVGATRVFGLYQPTTFTPLAWHVGPLLNPNNLAGYLNLGALAGIGLLLMHRPILPRWMVGLGVALIVGVDVTAASRGGMAALLLGLVAAALLARRRMQAGRSASLWGIGLVVLVGGLFAVLGSTRDTWNDLYNKDLSKLDMLLWARPLLREHPLFGVGRGAFESAFPAYRATPGHNVFTHAENFPVQWASEWGLPVGTLAMAAFAWSFGPRRIGALKSALTAGAWVGVVVVLLQNLLDLGLEIPALCVGLAMTLGSLWGDVRRRAPGDGGRRSILLGGPSRHAVLGEGRARLAAASVALAGVLLSTGAIAFGLHDVASDRAALRTAYEEAGSRLGERAPALRAGIAEAMRRHPAEPYFPLLGATVAFRTRAESPIPWLQRTLERAPVNGRAHLLLAEVLAARGARRQALLELRLSVENEPGLRPSAAHIVAAWTRDFDDLMTTVPEGRPGVGMLEAIAAELAAPEHREVRSRLDREAIARDGAVVAPRLREAYDRLAAMQKDATSSLCADRAACRRVVLEHAAAVERLEPERSLAAQVRARLFLVEGLPDEAARLLERACETVTDRVECLSFRLTVAAQAKAPDLLDAAAKAYLGASCTLARTCADAAAAIAGIRLGRGETNAALALFARAAREDPTEERWSRLADAANRAGAHGQALQALENMARLKGRADADLERRIQEQRSLTFGNMVR